MDGINPGRWLLGGVVTAAVLFVIDFIVNGLILAQGWNDALAALDKGPMGADPGDILVFLLLSLVTGVTAIWIYAASRTRFGPGVHTAICAGIVTWVLAYLVPNVFDIVSGIYPTYLPLTAMIVALFEVPLATVAGAYFYQE